MEPKSKAQLEENSVKRTKSRYVLNERLLDLLDSAKTSINSIRKSRKDTSTDNADERPLLDNADWSTDLSKDSEKRFGKGSDEYDVEKDQSEKKKAGLLETESGRYAIGLVVCLMFTLCDTATKTFAQVWILHINKAKDDSVFINNRLHVLSK